MGRPVVRFTVLLVCVAALALFGTAHAATYYVATSGNDTTGSGTSGSPWATIQKAVDSASNGDTIEVAAGTYTKGSGDRVVVTIEDISNLTIQGDASGGTIIDGSDHTITSGWSGPNGYGTYSISRPVETYGQWPFVTVDMGDGPETLVTGYADAYSGGTFLSWSLWYWSDHINAGMPNPPGTHSYYDQGDGYETLRGCAFHNASNTYSNQDNGYLYVKMVDDDGDAYDVNDYTIKCSRKSMAGLPCGGFLLDDNADSITIRNLEFQNGYYQLLIYESDDAIIENCVFRAYKNCMKLFGDGTGNSGAGSVTVRYCELDVHPFALRSGYTGKHNEYGAQIWKTQKEWGDQDWWGIFMAGTKGGHHFHDNYIHDGWDGIGGGAANGDWEDTECNHNLIINCLDDPIDIYGNCSGAKVHHNVSINSQQQIRIRGIDTDAGEAFYFYNNMLLRGPMTEQAVNFSSGVTGVGTAYFYQNTIEQGEVDECTHETSLNRGIFCNQNADCTYDGWWWANNLFHGFQWTKNDPAGGAEIDWQADYNVYSLNDSYGSWQGTTGRIDTGFSPDRNIDTNNNTIWSTSAPGYVTYDATSAATWSYTDDYDVSLVSSSPAIDAGSSDLNTLFGLSAGTLPGTLSNDCGAVAEGGDMLVVPRWDSPVLSSISPNCGTPSGGTAVTLSGSNLTGTTSVKFGATSATSVSVVSDTTVTCTSPSGSAGAVSVTATTSEGTSNGKTYTYGDAPTLTSLSPTSGTASGGTTVTLTGTNLTGTSSVSFGGNAATSVSVLSGTSVSCDSPSGTEGNVAVTATTAIGTSGVVSYEYTSSGETSTTLTSTKDGWAYSYTGGGYGTYTYTQVMATATNDKQTYLCFDISGVSGDVTDAKLRLCKQDVTSRSHSLAVFKVADDTWSEGVSWSSRPSETTPALSFVSGTRAQNDWIEWDVTDYVDTEVGASADDISFMIQDSGNSYITDQFYTRESANDPELIVVTGSAGPPAPTLSSISPTSGAQAGGTACTLTGTNFIAGATVRFASNYATSVSVVSSTSITCTSPAGDDPGAVNVSVTTDDGTSGNATFTYIAAPSLSSISPSTGTTAGGTAVTLSGSALTGCSAVSFGGTAGTSINVVSDTEVRCTSPAKSAGACAVTATTSYGTSGAVTYTYEAPPAAPTLSSLSPTSGTEDGGTAVTLTGTNLTGCSDVKFGATSGTSIVVDSATQVRCTSPAGSAGDVAVTAVTAGGTSGAVTFTYTGGGEPTTTTLTSSKDGWAYSYTGGGYGTYTYTQVMATNSHDKQSYFCFDISSLSGDVTDAKLRLCKQDATSRSHTLAVYSVADDTWTEGCTWANRPTETTPAVDTHSSTRSQNNWYEWDVTSFVDTEVGASANDVSFMLQDSGNSYITEYYYTRESANDPELVVITE